MCIGTGRLGRPSSREPRATPTRPPALRDVSVRPANREVDLLWYRIGDSPFFAGQRQICFCCTHTSPVRPTPWVSVSGWRLERCWNWLQGCRPNAVGVVGRGGAWQGVARARCGPCRVDCRFATRVGTLSERQTFAHPLTGANANRTRRQRTFAFVARPRRWPEGLGGFLLDIRVGGPTCLQH